MTLRRRVLLPFAALTALALGASGCGGADSSTTRTAVTTSPRVAAGQPAKTRAVVGSPATTHHTSRSTSSKAPRALLPIQHTGTHPGAAALKGDVKHVVKAAFVPTVKKAPNDGARSGNCQVPQPKSTPVYCTFGDKTHPKLTIALVGDSVAGQWLRGLEKVALAHHWRIVTALHSRCPWTATMTVNSGETKPYTSCHSWGASVLRHLLTKLHPGAVITTDRPVLGTTQYKRGAAASTAIGKGMASYWKQLIAHKIAVIGLRETPEMGFDVPSCVARKGSCNVSRGTAIARTTPIVVADRLVTHGERMLDLGSLICTASTCHAVVGNVLVYQDQHHLTNTYVLTMAPYLERKLLAVPKLAAAA